MKRSVFLLIIGIGVGVLGVGELRLRKPSEQRLESYVATAGRPGRCHASRRRTRWSGYTIDELAA
jgi:hypothetical protein